MRPVYAAPGRAGRGTLFALGGRPLANLVTGILIGLLIGRLTLKSEPAEGTARPDRHPDPPLNVSQASREGRISVVALVGVQTGYTTDPRPKYNYEARRQALRASWFPASQQQLDRLEQEQGIVVRFVVGRSQDPAQQVALDAEEQAHGGFLRLNLTEAYLSLPTKTLMFLRAVTQQYDAQYVVKVDDDVYFRLDRLPHAVQQWSDIHADYIGCMKTGQIIKSPRYRWYEPQHTLLGGGNYFTHAWGPIYVLSGRVAADLAAMRDGSLRHFANEDVTIGSWLLAFNATHFDDRRLCETNCTASSLAVYDIPVCAGLCDAAKQLMQLHASPACQTAPTTPTGGLPLAKPIFLFDQRPDPAWEMAARRSLRQQWLQAAQGIKPQHPEYDSWLPHR